MDHTVSGIQICFNMYFLIYSNMSMVIDINLSTSLQDFHTECDPVPKYL